MFKFLKNLLPGQSGGCCGGAKAEKAEGCCGGKSKEKSEGCCSTEQDNTSPKGGCCGGH